MITPPARNRLEGGAGGHGARLAANAIVLQLAAPFGEAGGTRCTRSADPAGRRRTARRARRPTGRFRERWRGRLAGRAAACCGHARPDDGAVWPVECCGGISHQRCAVLAAGYGCGRRRNVARRSAARCHNASSTRSTSASESASRALVWVNPTLRPGRWPWRRRRAVLAQRRSSCELHHYAGVRITSTHGSGRLPFRPATPCSGRRLACDDGVASTARRASRGRRRGIARRVVLKLASSPVDGA